MTWRTGHGKGAGVPRIEVLPADELPNGVQAPEQVEHRDERRADGTFAEGARTIQSAGGRARKLQTRLARTLGSVQLPSEYVQQARAFRKQQVRNLAKTVGGGICGPAPASFVASASLQLAASRFAFDKGDFEKGSKLANDSRQNLLAAHELCAKEAAARPKQSSRERINERLRQAESESKPVRLVTTTGTGR